MDHNMYDALTRIIRLEKLLERLQEEVEILSTSLENKKEVQKW